MANRENGNMCDTPCAKINVKKCVQCEETFSKKQKAMNCSVCKYWFCLECSHVSSKLYETLRNESSTNLPFNCDGCVRLLPSLTDIASRCRSFEDKIKELELSIDERIQCKVEKAIEEFKEREDRKCNVIMHNIPESSGDNKNLEDKSKVGEIFRVMECREVDVKEVIRLGKPTAGKKRLLKVTLGSVSNKHKVLGGTKLLRSKDERGEPLHEYNNIFVTPDLTKEERDRNAALRNELNMRRRDEKNNNLVIYRGKIVDKMNISSANKEGQGKGDPKRSGRSISTTPPRQ